MRVAPESRAGLQLPPVRPAWRRRHWELTEHAEGTRREQELYGALRQAAFAWTRDHGTERSMAMRDLPEGLRDRLTNPAEPLRRDRMWGLLAKEERPVTIDIVRERYVADALVECAFAEADASGEAWTPVLEAFYVASRGVAHRKGAFGRSTVSRSTRQALEARWRPIERELMDGERPEDVARILHHPHRAHAVPPRLVAVAIRASRLSASILEEELSAIDAPWIWLARDSDVRRRHAKELAAHVLDGMKEPARASTWDPLLWRHGVSALRLIEGDRRRGVSDLRWTPDEYAACWSAFAARAEHAIAGEEASLPYALTWLDINDGIPGLMRDAVDAVMPLVRLRLGREAAIDVLHPHGGADDVDAEGRYVALVHAASVGTAKRPSFVQGARWLTPLVQLASLRLAPDAATASAWIEDAMHDPGLPLEVLEDEVAALPERRRPALTPRQRERFAEARGAREARLEERRRLEEESRANQFVCGTYLVGTDSYAEERAAERVRRATERKAIRDSQIPHDVDEPSSG